MSDSGQTATTVGMTALERALRDAFRALAPVAKATGFGFTPESGLDVDALAGELRSLFDWVLDAAYVAERGARHTWETTNRDDWTPEILIVDLDEGVVDDW